MGKQIILALFFCALAHFAAGADKVEKNIVYTERADAYSRERCKLDIYIPQGKIDGTLVWFHGGGISGGEKKFPANLKNSNIILVAPNYRLSPKIKAHEAIEDAADAIKWTFENIEKYGGDKKGIFVGGHSAGAYLSGMVAAAPEYLKRRGLKNTDIAGAILLSGQATTHFRVRADLGDKNPQYLPKIDELSIIGNAANKMPPVCIILGDRTIEFPERVEENFLLAAVLKKLNTSPIVEIFELQGLNHGTVVKGLAPIAKSFIKRVAALDKNSEIKAESKNK